MCGINGYITYKKETDIKNKINLMNDLIFHRGPDDEGIFISKNDDYSIALGMRRLSIIDLYSGSQPIYSKDKQNIIVFNGEIYNYKELRNNLINEGIEFSTNSDTEVILHMYAKYGVDSFSKLDGMFAFTIYDKKLNKIFIVRDYFGEKPLYYFSGNNKFIWASELKSIVNVLDEKPIISKQAMNLYFQLTYIPAPFSIYENIYKLEANHYIEYDCSLSKIDIQDIHHNDYKSYKEKLSFSNAKKQTYDLVMESVKSRCVSDVPIGTFLSGGIDSSIISLCLAEYSFNPINTFSIGFEKASFDETDKSKKIAKLLNSNHHQFIVGQRQIENNINDIILNFDEPFADSSALPTYMVSKLTKGHVKVVLTGDGGDEMFGGYNKYYMGKMNNYYTSLIPKKLHNYIIMAFNNMFTLRQDNRKLLFRIKRLLNAIDFKDYFYYNIISLGFQDIETKKIFNKEYVINDPLSYYKNQYNGNNTLHDFRKIDKNISLEGDMLVKVDRASMLNSIECRSPFLNKEIWNFTNSLPDSFLIRGWNKKYLLKETFKQYFPNGFLNKPKQGFGVPVGDWMKDLLRLELLSYASKEFVDNQGIFNYEYIRKLVLDHIDNRADNTFRVWTFFCFQKWYKETYMQL